MFDNLTNNGAVKCTAKVMKIKKEGVSSDLDITLFLRRVAKAEKEISLYCDTTSKYSDCWEQYYEIDTNYLNGYADEVYDFGKSTTRFDSQGEAEEYIRRMRALSVMRQYGCGGKDKLLVDTLLAEEPTYSKDTYNFEWARWAYDKLKIRINQLEDNIKGEEQ